IEINIVIIISVKMHFDIKSATHTEGMSNHLRVTECEVYCLIASEAAAGSNYARVSGFLLCTAYHFFQNHLIIDDMIFYPLRRMNMCIIPTQLVNTVRAIDFNKSTVNKIGYTFNEFEIAVLIMPSHTCWKSNHRDSTITKNQHIKITTNNGLVITDRFFFHN